MCPGGYPIVTTQNWRSAFLPGVYQGTYIDTPAHATSTSSSRTSATPDLPPAEQREQLDLVAGAERRAPDGARSDDAAARSPHPLVRAGLPDADRGGRGVRPDAASRSRSASCTATPSTAGSCCSRGGWSSAACGSCRSGAGPGSRGTTTTTSRSSTASSPAQWDQPIAALLDRPEAARPARRHAGAVGRRVRPHAGRGAAGAQRPRPQPLRLHLLAGRRRREGRHGRTARPTSSASRRSRTRSTSTTCTRRCCTCSASTTRS